MTKCGRHPSRGQEQANVVVVHDLALRPDREIGGNEPGCPSELAAPFGYFPNHRAPLKAVHPACPKHTMTRGLERHPAGLAVADAPALNEGPRACHLHLRLERRTGAWFRFRLGLDALGCQCRAQDLAGRGRLGGKLSLDPFDRTCLPFELQCENEFLHALFSSGWVRSSMSNRPKRVTRGSYGHSFIPASACCSQ